MIRWAKYIAEMLVLCCIMALESCVHEWPGDGNYHDAELTVRHKQEWTRYEMLVSRDGGSEHAVRYHMMMYRAGDIKNKLFEHEFTSSDLSRDVFTHRLNLPPGTYDIYCWSDYAKAETGDSYFFDSSNFAIIKYSEPYNGNNELRDAFRGMTTVTIDNSLEKNYYAKAELNMERPLARYEFISTDLAKFLENEITRTKALLTKAHLPIPAEIQVPISQYTVKAIYTGYMPSEFNNFTNRPINSRVGMTYDATIEIINDDEARIGFDYVMVNGHESSVPVAMEVYDPEGRLIARTNTINVPTKRSQLTVVRGEFLTSMAQGGVGIDPSFNGSFNIEIK